jgi:hypothetical protein
MKKPLKTRRSERSEHLVGLLHDGLGMIKGSYCPHYDADQRRPLFHAALLDGSLEMGYASWNRVAIHFTPKGEVVEAVSSEPGGRALKVYAREGQIVEEDIPCRQLEERAPSISVSTTGGASTGSNDQLRRVESARSFQILTSLVRVSQIEAGDASLAPVSGSFGTMDCPLGTR